MTIKVGINPRDGQSGRNTQVAKDIPLETVIVSEVLEAGTHQTSQLLITESQ